MNRYIRMIALTLAFLTLPAFAGSCANRKTAAYPPQIKSLESVKNGGSLAGLSICIDPGHGKVSRSKPKTEPIAPSSDIQKTAIASGTAGVYTGVTEESLNLTVSRKLQKVLLENGAKVIMVRESDGCNLTNVERAKFWNATDADLTIRIHGNGINDRTVSGVLMMVPGDKYIKDKEVLRKSREAGEQILESVLEHTKAKSRGLVETSELTGFNWSEIPVVLLEMGFMTNPQEDKLLNTEEYQDKIAAGVAEGLIKYKRNLKD